MLRIFFLVLMWVGLCCLLAYAQARWKRRGDQKVELQLDGDTPEKERFKSILSEEEASRLQKELDDILEEAKSKRDKPHTHT